ncbi:MAG: ribbon-helix-helix domain-containing protein [Bacillota bacterium]
MSKAKKVTITLTDDLLAVLDSVKKRERTTRSGAVAGLLRHARRVLIEAEMAEGYRALRDESREDARLSFPAQAEVILRDEP